MQITSDTDAKSYPFGTVLGMHGQVQAGNMEWSKGQEAEGTDAGKAR